MTQLISKYFLTHPRSVGESYGAHLWFALKFAGLLLMAATAALIHAILPWMFEKTASRIITQLYDRMHNRAG